MQVIIHFITIEAQLMNILPEVILSPHNTNDKVLRPYDHGKNHSYEKIGIMGS